MPPHVHRLTSVDDAANAAVCAHCGPVELGWKRNNRGEPRPKCSVALRAQRNSPNRNPPPGQTKWHTVKTPYGLTRRQAQERLKGAQCEICGDPATANDHCHETDRLRGKLCHLCNLGIGYFKDNPELLLAAAAYLRGHGLVDASA